MSGWRGDGWQDAPAEPDPDAWAQAYREAREREALQTQEWVDAEAEYEAEEAGVRARQRGRRRRSLLTVSIVLLAMFFGFWYAYSYVRSGSGQSAAATTTSCAPHTLTAKPSDITLNIYNATNRAGLAAVTAKKTEELGFKTGTVSNDPLGRGIVAPAEVRYGANGIAGAELVMAIVGNGVTTAMDSREDTSIDLVLGQSFSTLGPVPSPGLTPCPSASASPSAATP